MTIQTIPFASDAVMLLARRRSTAAASWPERPPGVTCRGCGAKLPRSRMRNCPDCFAELPGQDPTPGPAAAPASLRPGPSWRRGVRSDRGASGWDVPSTLPTPLEAIRRASRLQNQRTSPLLDAPPHHGL